MALRAMEMRNEMRRYQRWGAGKITQHYPIIKNGMSHALGSTATSGLVQVPRALYSDSKIHPGMRY